VSMAPEKAPPKSTHLRPLQLQGTIALEVGHRCALKVQIRATGGSEQASAAPPCAARLAHALARIARHLTAANPGLTSGLPGVRG
jgi:hypothetical protein